jgi:hypothetical protein
MVGKSSKGGEEGMGGTRADISLPFLPLPTGYSTIKLSMEG